MFSGKLLFRVTFILRSVYHRFIAFAECVSHLFLSQVPMSIIPSNSIFDLNFPNTIPNKQHILLGNAISWCLCLRLPIFFLEALKVLGDYPQLLGVQPRV